MINSEQTLTALAHCALGLEEVFRRCFIGYQWIVGNVAQAVNGLRNSVCSAADETAAFVRRGFASVFDDFVSMRLLENNHF